MAFLAPIALWGLLLVSLPLLIHLLVRRRGRRLDFPSLRYLSETPSFKLYPRHIRQPLLLALRAAAIILLVLGLARPLFTFRSQTPETVRFILLDASLSMKTRGRTEAAKEQARILVNRLQKGERAGVIALASEAILLTELTEDRDRLLKAIERYEPTGGAIDYGAGIAEIRRQLESEPVVVAEAAVISDFQESGLEGRAFASLRAASFLRLATYPVGAGIERNAFLIDEVVRKTERGFELSASEITSEPEGRKATRHTWTIDGDDGSASGIEWSTQLNNQLTGRIKILEADDFDADDERYFAFAPPGENRTLLIEDGTNASLYLRAALETVADEKGAARTILETRPRLPESGAELASYSLIVLTLRGQALESETNLLAEYVRAGGTVWMFLARDLDTESWSRLASGPAKGALPFESIARKSVRESLRFGALDTEAPQLRGMDESAQAAFSAVRVSEGYDLVPNTSSDTLIRWSDNAPAFIYGRVGKGAMLLLATSLERASSELGLSPSLPALASSILHSTSTYARAPLSQTIGEAVRLNVAPRVEVKIKDAKGNTMVAKASDLVMHPLLSFREPGVYQLEFAGQQKYIAFNAPALESERQLATPDKLKNNFSINEERKTVVANAGQSREATEQSGSVWRSLLCAAFLLIIAELCVSMRRRKVMDG